LTRLIDNLLEAYASSRAAPRSRQQHLQLHEIVQDAVELVGSLFTQARRRSRWTCRKCCLRCG